MVPIPKGLFDNVLHIKGVGRQEGIHNKTSAIQEIGKSIFWTIHAFITSLAGMSYKIGVVFKMAFYEQTVQR